MAEKSFAERAAEAKARRAAQLALESANGSLSSDPLNEKKKARQEKINILEQFRIDTDPFTDWEVGFIASVLNWLKSKETADLSEKQQATYEKLRLKYHEYYT